MAAKPLPKPAKWLETALKHVPRLGWTDDALVRAAADLGVDSALISLIFPNKTADLVALFHQSVDEAMEMRIGKHGLFASLKVRQKVAFGVRARLEAMAGQEDAVRRLHGWAASPRNARRALKMVWESCDKIWWHAGDTATDYNHYTKRLLLAQVYQRTLLFWLSDKSKGKTATWEYVDERLDKVLKVGPEIGKLKDIPGMAGAVFRNWKSAA